MSHFPVAPDPTIDHPPYYGGEDNVYEVIKILEHYELGFHLGNTVKYILRAGRKSGRLDKFVQDLKKARWYLDRMISNHEGMLVRQYEQEQAQASRPVPLSPNSVVEAPRKNGRRAAQT